LQEAGIALARAGKVRLLRVDELPAAWNPLADQRLTVWESVHHLIRALNEGETAAAALVARLGARAEAARELAYRLYQVCERRKRAQEVVDKFQWITAATVFTNPIPALDLMATGAVQFQMISEIAAVYGVELSTGHVKMIGGQMIQTLLKLGMIEAATSLIAGLFKSTLIGYAAGGAVQVVTMAYLTHISGQTFAEYFARGQDWGDGGMQAALARQFDLNRRADFLQEFARQALDRVVRRVVGPREAGPDKATTRNEWQMPDGK
jgi:uncharacterized protein (DUF697 family)